MATIKNSSIRKLFEKRIIESTDLYVDFNEEGGKDKTEFLRINTPLVISDIASINSALLLNDGTISIQIFTQSKSRCIDVYDQIASNLNVGGYIEDFDIRLNVTRCYTDYYAKDSVGSYYQVNFSVDYFVYT